MEGYGPATYGDRFADVYDDWYADVSDVEATVERVVALAGGADAAAGGAERPAVLELGAGSGRLALPLAAAGLDVWALDASPAMVGRLRAKPGAERVTWIQGTAESAAEGAFDSLLVAVVLFQVLIALVLPQVG